MSGNHPNLIEAIYAKGQTPRITEHSNPVVRINKLSTAAASRCRQMYERAQIVAASLTRCQQSVICAQDLFLSDDYSTFSHREKCLNGMVVAFLCRQGLIPWKFCDSPKSPKHYELIPEAIRPEYLSYANTTEEP